MPRCRNYAHMLQLWSPHAPGRTTAKESMSHNENPTWGKIEDPVPQDMMQSKINQ